MTKISHRNSNREFVNQLYKSLKNIVSAEKTFGSITELFSNIPNVNQAYLRKCCYGFCLVISVFMFTSCDTNILLKDNYDVPDAKWLVKETPVFTFEVTDTIATFNVFYNVRNNRSYSYYNLYLTHYLTNPNGKVIHQHLDEIVLFDQTTGKPLGEGLGDIYDHKVLAFKDYRFPIKGTYKIELHQYMRQNPLLDIVSAGITIEKSTR